MMKFYKRVIPLLLFLLFLQGYVFAQEEVTLKGKLVDEQTGEPVVGASIFIKGTKSGTQTDLDGNYEIKTTATFPFTVVVSYIGYQNKEVEVYDVDEPLDVKLRSSQILSEVVIVGYGEQKREDVTGSVSSVPTELKKQPVASAERLLQGSVAGATVTQATGQPGAGVSVQIRGANSISAGSEPLYVIDGFPVNGDNSFYDAGVTDGPKISPMSTINPNDIESMDVLKDASATAIYGSRGANGVVIINTKRGDYNKSSITYDGYYGVQTLSRKIPLLNAAQWWQLRKEASANTPNGKSPALTQGNFIYDTTGTGTDWQDEAFREAPIQSHSLSILGGNESTRYSFSGNYFKQDGILLNTGFERFAGRLNIDNDYSKRLKFGASISASQINTKVAPQAVVPNILLTSPAIPVYDTTGAYVRNTSTDSPLQNPINSLQNQINTTKTGRFLGNVSADYKIIPGLTAKILVGADVINNKQNRYLPNSTYEGNASGAAGQGGVATVGSAFTTGWLNENTLTYTKKVGKDHQFIALAGFTAQAYTTERTVASSNQFAFDQLTYNSLGDANTAVKPSSSYNKSTLESYLGRLNYIFKDRYLLTATIRADGSSRFGPSNKWGYFPSAALGWNVHKESFFTIKQISNLKPRVSYGITGNQDIGNYNSIGKLYNSSYNFNGTTVTGYYPGTVNNPNLKWEKTSQFDIGVDVGLFKNRINIIFDYYYKKTTDLLYGATVAGTSGLSYYDPNLNASQSATVYQNIGSVENKGIELALNTQNIVGKKLSWNTIFVFSRNQNKVLDLGPGVNRIQPNINIPSVLQVGAPIGSFYVYQTDGLIKPGEEGANALTPQANKTVGGQKYKDINGDGKITQAGDRVLIKNDPGVNFGLTNTLNYKTSFGDFDLTLFFQANVGAKLYNQNRANLELNTGYTNGSADMLNRYNAGNTDTDVKEAYQDPAIVLSDRYIEDASYLRLKNLTIGYTLPTKWTTKAIKNVRIYASFQNIATWTKYTGYDPEASTNTQGLIYRGIDNGAYPNSKTILGGISLTF